MLRPWLIALSVQIAEAFSLQSAKLYHYLVHERRAIRTEFD